MSKMRVLFVCLGNICRSPMAEAIFNHKIKERGLTDRFESDSCGTSNYHIDEPPDHRTVQNLKRNGVLIDHLGRQLTEEDLESFHYILAMDKSNFNNISRLDNFSDYKNKVSLMRRFDPEEKDGEVPDPYYGGEQGFQEVFDMLDRAIDNFIDQILNEEEPS